MCGLTQVGTPQPPLGLVLGEAVWLLEPVHLMFWVPLGPVGPEPPRGTWGYTSFSSYSRWAMPAGVFWGFRAC